MKYQITLEQLDDARSALASVRGLLMALSQNERLGSMKVEDFKSLLVQHLANVERGLDSTSLSKLFENEK